SVLRCCRTAATDCLSEWIIFVSRGLRAVTTGNEHGHVPATVHRAEMFPTARAVHGQQPTDSSRSRLGFAEVKTPKIAPQPLPVGPVDFANDLPTVSHKFRVVRQQS